MLVWMLLMASAVGFNLALWGTIGAVRFLGERHANKRSRPGGHQAIGVEHVAVLIPAHNEALVIEKTVAAITRLVPAANVYVISDGSTDATAGLALRAGANVLELPVAGGKASALKAGIEHFDIRYRYSAALLLDADTRLDDRYFEVALPYFDDPAVCAVAGCATTMWKPAETSPAGQLLAAHRDRVYFLFQYLVKYGQCSKRANVTPIVPGFASLYRTAVLDEVQIDRPGLVIEDFNMTFDVHRLGLGRVAFDPRAKAYTEDPHRLGDYYRQVKRWSLGFWQTVRAHGVWASKFWAALGLMILELITSSVALLLAAVVLVALVSADLFHEMVAQPGLLHDVVDPVASLFSYRDLAVGILLPDFLLTCITAAVKRRPRYLLLGVLFVPLRVLDALALLISIPRAWLVRSTGRWTSPQRHGADDAPIVDLPAFDVPVVDLPALEHPVPVPAAAPPLFAPVGAPVLAQALWAEPVAQQPSAIPTIIAPATTLPPRPARPSLEFELPEPDAPALTPAAGGDLPDWALQMLATNVLSEASSFSSVR